jgi:Zn-dependent M28 family amino/carboxypeptidase
MSRTKYAIAFALALVMALGAVEVASAAVQTDTTKLRNAVNVGGILKHERALQAIADRNGDTRASGTRGYNASVDYVAGKLRAAGYDVTVQPFDFRLFTENSPSELQQISPTPTTYVNGQNFATMEYSGSRDVTATVRAVDTAVQPTDTSTSGCETSDFAGFAAGNIALMQRGTCPFGQKAANAQAAEASAVLIFNRGTAGNEGVVNGTLGADSNVTIPALGLDFATGADLADPAGTVARVSTDTKSEAKQTANVLADTPNSTSEDTVVVGAHLDSVAEGPGINDNGSGSATILEVAEEMSELGIQPQNNVRFAFWGAEESGLIGSTYYVNNLSDEEFDKLALNLNFDMVGSPNYVRFVYDGDGSAFGTAGPAGSDQIEKVFNDYFASRGLQTDPTAFDGRSDYRPFILEGIPAGGLFTGAEGVKTERQAGIYGGLAGTAYDPCYHQFCDSLSPVKDGADADLYAALDTAYGGDLAGNLNTRALNEMSDATAHATLTFAQTGLGASGAAETSGTAKASKPKYKGPHLER